MAAKRPNTERYRYRGVDPFEQGDQDIFRGRKESTEQLYTRLMLSKTLVLHAESGTGKSSLLQAGLIDTLKEQQPGYLVVTIRLDYSRAPITTLEADPNAQPGRVKTLLEQLISRVREAGQLQETPNLPFIDRCKDSLWSLGKLLAQKNGDGPGCKLLLILDQFEELQTFDDNEILEFKKALCDLLNSQIPADLLAQVRANKAAILKKDSHTPEERMAYNVGSQFLDAPLDAKAIFVVREDKLGTMSMLSDVFPDILKNDFILDLLSPENALKAIIEPAQLPGNFKSSKFRFEDLEAVKEKVAEIANDGTKMVDPIQLQIVCRSIEESIVIKKRKTVISKDDFPNVKDVVAERYNSSWEAVKNYLRKSSTDANDKRRSIIQLLVVNKSRNLVHADLLISKDKSEEDTQIIAILRSKGLIREVLSGRVKYYQLCHDRFVPPLLEDLDNLLRNQELLRTIDKGQADLASQTRKNFHLTVVLISLVCLMAICVAYISYIKFRKIDSADQAKLMGLVKGLRTTNPTLAYEVIRSYQESKGTSLRPEFDRYVKHLDSVNDAYLLYTFPIAGTLVQTALQVGKKHVDLIESSSVTGWDIGKGMIDSVSKLTNNEKYVKLVRIHKVDYWVVIGNNYIDIRDGSGRSYGRRFRHGNVKNIDVTEDGKYILFAEMVYELGSQRLVGKLPVILGKTNDLVVDIFLNDSRHIAAGYYSGYKAVFEIGASGIRTVALFPPLKDLSQSSPVVTSLATDGKDSCLIAGNRNNSIEIWRLDSLDSRSSAVPYSTNNPRLVLTGHTGEINTVSLSQNDSMILSGSKDHTAVLWDLHTGNKMAILKGMNDEVVYARFFRNKNLMVTSTKNGVVYIWGYGKAPELNRQYGLAHFTPFDYYNAEFEDRGAVFAQQYDTSDINRLFSRTLHYISNLPSVNNHPDNEEYLDNLDYSIREVDRMFASLVGNKAFKNMISDANKIMLYQLYAALWLNRRDLLQSNNAGDGPGEYEGYGRYALYTKEQHLLEKADLKTLFGDASRIASVANMYRHAGQYEKSMYYLQNMPSQVRATIFSFKLASGYLLTRKADSALYVADQLDPFTRYHNVVRLCAMLEKGNYDEAVQIFKESAYPNGKLDGSFMFSLNDLVVELANLPDMPAVKKFQQFLKGIS